MAFTVTWSPLGYSVYDVFNYPYTTAPPLYSSKQAVCESYPSLIGLAGGKACYEPSVGDYCVPQGQPCFGSDGVTPNAWPYSGSIIAPAPVCTYTNLTTSPPIIDRRPSRPKNVRADVGWSQFASTCACVSSSGRPASDLVPDLSTGWCYDPYSLDFVISRTQYKPSQALVPAVLTVIVRRGDNTPAANVAITLNVTSADGTPGTLSPSSGVTDANGQLTANYTFPQFDKKKTDTIEVGCATCSVPTGQLTMTMSPTVIGFFNGVWNTQRDAQNSYSRLKREFGSSYQANNTSYQGASLVYDWFYNQTGCVAGKVACIEDIFETFAQRNQELGGVLSNRWEVFWEMLAGRHTQSTSLTGTLLGYLGGVGNALLQLIDATFSAMVNQLVALTGNALSHPPTAADVAAHLAKLKAYADDDYTLVLVAHSQGNLFVNAAYDGLMASKPGAIARVVHVAPASPTVRGGYVLADIDAVINSLRLSGIGSVQPVNIYLSTSKTDPSGHMFEGTYVDTVRAAYGRVKYLVGSAVESL